MKKFFKSLSVICLALVLLCPIALVGCARNYTVNIQIAQNEEGGFVYLKDAEGVSVLGDNTVKSGEKFEYFVVPATGYQIAKILVDGEEQTSFDADGSYLYFDEVNKNHEVKVYFEARSYDVNFYCIAVGGGYTPFGTIRVRYGDSVSLNASTYGGANNTLWYVRNGNKKVYIYNGLEDPTAAVPAGHESNLMFVYGNKSVYCDKTAAELADLNVAIPN